MNVQLKPAVIANPFPGLRPFKQGEEHFFFGRENQTDTLLDKLRQTRFLAVIGSSGSGKSSLVNCGLLPALYGGLMPKAGTSWRIAHCRPSGMPIRSLANALASPGTLFDKFDSKALDLADVIESTLHMSQAGISDTFEMARPADNVNLLVVVDQFEELFRYAAATSSNSSADTGFSDSKRASRTEAAEFIKLLLNARSLADKRIYIVLTMRSDFLGDCAQFEGLAEAINEGQYLVPRMTREERRLAIAGPIGVGGAQIDSVLLTRLVNDLGDDPDQLSILQHALNRMWARWAGLGKADDPLGLAHYNAVGSLQLALDQHAEKAYAELSTERQQRVCEKLFKALTNKATDRRGVRRPTSLAILSELTAASNDELVGIIAHFRKPSRSFLMPEFSQELHPDSIIDISHESLMRMWKRLSAWADQEAESTRVFQRLANTTLLHANGKAGLWRDPDLQLALEWRMRNEPNLCWASRIGPGFDQAMRFLDDSRAASDMEAADAIHRAEKDRELERTKAITSEQEKRLKLQAIAVRKQRQVTALIAGGLIVTSALSFFAFRQKDELEKQALVLADQTNELQTQLDKVRQVATHLAKTNQKLDKTSQQNNSLETAQSEQHMILATAMQLLEQQEVIRFDQDRQREFVNQSDASIIVFTIDAQGYQLYPTLIAPRESVTVSGASYQLWLARILPSGELIATGSLDEGTAPIILSEPDD